MKELQKYYVYGEYISDVEFPHHTNRTIYLASEADAAFAEMRREHVQALIEQRDTESGRLHKIFDAEIERLKQHHAEEIERLKAERNRWKGLNDENQEYISQLREHVSKLRKQAERYEKLRKLNVYQFRNLYVSNIRGEGRFDDLVDQLPASGEAQKQPKTLLDFGYAPGDYFSTCLTCNSQIQDVDKRCYCCKPCAQAKLDKWNGREAQK